MNRPRQCESCQVAGPIKARGLCTSCYGRHYRQGTLGQFASQAPGGRPPVVDCGRPAQVAEDTAWLRANGYSQATTRQMAERLGMTVDAYRKAMLRTHHGEQDLDESAVSA